MSLHSQLESLEIPSEYAESNSTEVISRLNAWKESTHRVLRDLLTLLKEQELSVPEQADVIATAASFEGENIWITPESCSLAKGSKSRFYFAVLLNSTRQKFSANSPIPVFHSWSSFSKPTSILSFAQTPIHL